MKKVFLSVLFVSLAWAALSQPIIARSGPANTVQDARATWLYNAFLPRFADTTAANVQKGIDSCGAVIYTYDINGLWFRQCSPKKWIMLNNSSPYSSSGWNVGGNLFPVTVIPSRNIGTLAPYGGAIGLMTNSVTRLILPDYGLIYSNAATDSFLGRDIDGNLVLKTASGGGGTYTAGYGLSLGGSVFSADSATLAAYFLRRKDSATGTNLDGYLTRTSVRTYSPGIDDVLAVGQALTDDRSIDVSGNDFRIFNANDISINSLDDGVYIRSDGLGLTSFIMVENDSIKIAPNMGKINIDSLRAGGTSEDSVMVISSGGMVRKRNAADFGGSSGIDDVLAVGQALTDDRSIDVSGNDFEIINAHEIYFGNTGLFTISQNAKASVSGTNGTAHVSPLIITGGAGGATSYSVGTVLGGNAGVINITGGNGGNITGTPTTGVGGTGADINLTAGDGGLGTTNGGTAGVVNIAAGTGGQGTAGGAAGYVSIKGGFAGTSTNSDGGHIYLSPGQKQGSGLDGHIFLGISPSGAVRGAATIGSATRGDSLFNIKDGGLYADRGIQFPNIPSGTKDDSLVVKGSTGTIKYINTGDFTRQQDTISLASFGGGGGQDGDTTTFSTSTIYGSFYNDGSDTLVITSIRAIVLGTSPSVTPYVYFNDSLNVTAGATKLVNSPSALTNTSVGVSTTPDNQKIPPGVWVWVKTDTVTTKPTYFSLTLIGYKKRK